MEQCEPTEAEIQKSINMMNTPEADRHNFYDARNITEDERLELDAQRYQRRRDIGARP